MYSKNTNQSVVLHVMYSSYYTLVLIQLFAIKVYQYLLHNSAEAPGLLIHSHTPITHLNTCPGPSCYTTTRRSPSLKPRAGLC